jgi:outer membrane protein OmpA-like peptidoglycan-associated protein
MRRIVSLLLTVPLLASCAVRSAGTSNELVAARYAYAKAEASNAKADAPKSLAAARVSLNAAEEINKMDPGSQRERELAFIAHRRAQTAMAEARARAARRDADLARTELRRSTEEAAHALDTERARADAAQAQADAAARQAEAEVEQRQVAEQAAATARLSLEQVETELGDVRRQLAAQGTTLDEQTRQLKQRETTLQAQLDTLRAERDKAERERGTAVRERDEALAAMRKLGDVAERDRNLVLTIPVEVMFRAGQAKLLPHAKDKLAELALALHSLRSDQTFMIEGHTDSRGSAASNRRLSRLRAMAVRAYLINQGVDPDRIRAVGRGEEDPIASNSDREGRANNRRVEVIVTPATVSSR